MNDDKQRVLITGAGSGIGRAVAAELADSCHVIATARRLETLEATPCSQRLILDVTNSASVGRAVEAAGRIDVLVNNAGIGAGGPLESLPMDAVRRQFEVNMFGALQTTQAVLGQMRRRGRGVIVTISSVSARIPWSFGGAYAATKSALESFSEALHLELASSGVRIVLIEPGLIATRFADRYEIFGEGEPDYHAASIAWDKRFTGDRAPAAAVAQAVRGAIENAVTPLRVAVGDDAEYLLQQRNELDDEGLVAAMKSYYGISFDA